MTFTPTVLTDCYVNINGTTWADHASKAEIPIKVENKDATTFGQTWLVKRGGLKDGNLNLEFFNDFTAGNLDEIIWGLLGTVVSFEIRPTSAARSTSNPAYTGNILIDQWSPVMGKVGDLVTVSVGFPTSGTVTRAVT